MLAAYSRAITLYQMCLAVLLPSPSLETCQPCYTLPELLWESGLGHLQAIFVLWNGLSHIPSPYLVGVSIYGSLAFTFLSYWIWRWPQTGPFGATKDFLKLMSRAWDFAISASELSNTGGFICNSYNVCLKSVRQRVDLYFSSLILVILLSV